MADTFAVGDRVAMRGSHPWKGQAGEIINSPGKVFNGWNVRLDNGFHVGAADHHMQKLASTSNGSAALQENPRGEGRND